jgi:predicted MFS family arabinose efflux permease
VPNERDSERMPLDIVGGVLASVALALLTWGLITWSATLALTSPALSALSLGLLALLAFLWVEHRLGTRAMLPLALFGSANFVGLSLLTFLLYGALGGLLVLIPSVLIKVAGYSATAAGAALLPLPLVIALTSSTMGRIAGKLGARLPLIIGPVVTALGFALTLRMASHGSYWTTTFPALLVIAAGMSFAVAPLTTAVLGSVAPDHTGVASGFNSAIARTGGLVATAVLGGVLAAQGVRFEALFRTSAIAAAVVALMAGLCALLWVHDGTARSESAPKA